MLPIITKKKGVNIVIETCASMPGKEIVIGRPEEITVVYYSDEFNYEDNKLVGIEVNNKDTISLAKEHFGGMIIAGKMHSAGIDEPLVDLDAIKRSSLL